MLVVQLTALVVAGTLGCAGPGGSPPALVIELAPVLGDPCRDLMGRRPGGNDFTARAQLPFLNCVLADVRAALLFVPAAREVVAGGLWVEDPLQRDDDPPDAPPGQVEQELARAMAAAVARSPWAGGVPQGPIAAIRLPRIGVTWIEQVWPGRAEGPALERGDLTVTAWACPDRATAVAVYWLRSTSAVHWIKTEPTEELARSITKSRATKGLEVPIAAGEEVGERAGWYEPRLGIAVRPPKNPPAHRPTPPSRLVFIRGRVVIECGTWAFTPALRADAPREFADLGPLRADLVRLARDLDAALIRPPR